jgi:hypothetical protein
VLLFFLDFGVTESFVEVTVAISSRKKREKKKKKKKKKESLFCTDNGRDFCCDIYYMGL